MGLGGDLCVFVVVIMAACSRQRGGTRGEIHQLFREVWIDLSLGDVVCLGVQSTGSLSSSAFSA